MHGDIRKCKVHLELKFSFSSCVVNGIKRWRLQKLSAWALGKEWEWECLTYSWTHKPDHALNLRQPTGPG